MYLSRIRLEPTCPQARRDFSDPYQLHSTLCRAFSPPDRKCREGEFLWRLEPESELDGIPRILVQSRSLPDWSGIGLQKWLAGADPPIDLNPTLQRLRIGQHFRFRLRANPCVTRDGRRLGLKLPEEQKAWFERKGRCHGFTLPQQQDIDLSPRQEPTGVRISQNQMYRGRQHSGNGIAVFSVLYEGVLTVKEPQAFKQALQSGIGHGKMLGLGLLSVLPIK